MRQNYFSTFKGYKFLLPFSQSYTENENLGTNVYKQTYYKTSNLEFSFVRRRVYLGGILSTEFNFYEIKGEYYKVNLLGFKLYSFDVGPEGKFIKIFNCKLPFHLSFNYKKLFCLLKEYACFKTGYQNCNLINIFSFSGEINYLAHFMKDMPECQKDNLVFAVSAFSNRNILKMFEFYEPVVLVPYFFMRLGFCPDRIFDYGDGTSCNKLIDYQFFKQWEKVRENVPLIDFMNDYYKLELYSCRMPVITEEEKNEVDSFLETNQVTKPFIILNPISVNMQSFSFDFWKKLVESIHNKGYLCLINAETTSEYASLDLCCFFPHAQFRYLVSKCSALIGIRSGLLAIVADLAPQIHAFINPIGRNTSTQALKFWPLNKNIQAKAENIFEYECTSLSDEELINTVLDKLPQV